jgi:anti-sigma-K factor RskA
MANGTMIVRKDSRKFYRWRVVAAAVAIEALAIAAFLAARRR